MLAGAGFTGLAQPTPAAGGLAAEHMPARRVMRMNPQGRRFRRAWFPDVSDREWSDWKWQVRNRIQTADALRRMLNLSLEEEKALELGGGLLPMAITPHYMGLIDPLNPEQPIRRAMIPTVYELRKCPGEADDPLGEEHQSPVPGMVHRYPDRVLLLATDFCSAYCRYCTRSRVVGHGDLTPSTQRLQAAFDYIARHPQIRDVVISGGDPLTLGDERIEWILKSLRAIRHVEVIRLGTKIPAVLPQRITPQLVRMLRRYHPLWMSLHFMHPDECCFETVKACNMLADAGMPLGSQTVLLKGINDSVATMRLLVQRLMKMRVRPYYLYQCDPISGSAHFRTPVAKGIEIIQGLRGFVSGYAVPQYVIDAPGGGGKVPLMANAVVGRDGDDLILRNYEGRDYRYPDTCR
jgi:lysine 2,3-aminomutase